ncbi:hypothetical protein BDN70DRAFT_614475 [Pholiota conissans]|uniref:Uncharacterized protein n=1 Tax=Pholiota conissans TaxID=109636 RepID=A0A9P5Z6S4_9AGAR|nr:hypothetical protein BDN70DRAFT_614475 [Pholiota conissans]
MLVNTHANSDLSVPLTSAFLLTNTISAISLFPTLVANKVIGIHNLYPILFSGCQHWTGQF